MRGMAGRLGIFPAQLANAGGRFDTTVEQYLRAGQKILYAMIRVAARPYRMEAM